MISLSPKFSRVEFLSSGEKERKSLCQELGSLLTPEIINISIEDALSEKRELIVFQIISQLRSLGHDIKICDWDDDYERWGYEFSNPTSYGLMVDFHMADEVIVYWHHPPTPARSH